MHFLIDCCRPLLESNMEQSTITKPDTSSSMLRWSHIWAKTAKLIKANHKLGKFLNLNERCLTLASPHLFCNPNSRSTKLEDRKGREQEQALISLPLCCALLCPPTDLATSTSTRTAPPSTWPISAQLPSFLWGGAAQTWRQVRNSDLGTAVQVLNAVKSSSFVGAGVCP